ncbi:LysE family translocator [Cohnella sp. CFH 77786]|uniref:LysE family translocator n=1 Tax=Cohnella sp. CFH 77786 TaxID=2662265 RepID=UPI001C60CAE9|nr:LysE family translocator [Cohnella sp. CFH 77786]MBW5446325.1 LysE family translocator [Cohnella sp. CFH 77786]
MFGIDHYGLFLLSGVLLNLTPGTDTLYILSRTVAQGKKAGILSVLGISFGALFHTLFAAFGLSVVLMQSALVFNVVKWIGAAYLICLGIQSIRAKTGPLELQRVEPIIGRKIFLQGLLTNVLNPKVALFFLAFLPQFIDPANSAGMLPFVLLGLTFFATGTAWCLVLVWASELMSRKLRRSSFSRYLSKMTGFIFIGLGIRLLSVSRN